MRSFTFVALLWALLQGLVTCSPLTPPILPLVVRNPYLSTWLQNAREAPWTRWPMFWTGEEVFGNPSTLIKIFRQLIVCEDWIFGLGSGL